MAWKGANEMRTGFMVAIFLAGTALAERCGAESETSPLAVEATAAFSSKYVWRGQNVVDDWVFQPSAALRYGALSASIWGNLELTNETDHEGEFTEMDYALDYSGRVPSFDAVGFSVGFIYYDFPNTDLHDTAEVYAGVCLDVPAQPSLTAYHDIDEVEGTYLSFAVSHTMDRVADLSPSMPVGVEIGASVGWGNRPYNDGYWGVGGSACNDLLLAVAFPFEVAGVSVTPSVTYVTLLGSDIRTAAAKDDLTVIGLGFAREF